MKVGVSLPKDLLEFADAEARSRGTTRSGRLPTPRLRAVDDALRLVLGL